MKKPLTEAEWLSATDPQPLLEALRAAGVVSERRLCLWGCACVRRVWHLLMDERAENSVVVAERYADGLVDWGDLRRARVAVRPAFAEARGVHLSALQAVVCITGDANWLALYAARAGHWEAERTAQSALLRDIFGPLRFRPVTLDPSWLTSPVPELGLAAYEQRSLPDGRLHNDRLAVLADCLEEKGCDNKEVLGHLRQQGAVHVRGCWVVDLLLKRT